MFHFISYLDKKNVNAYIKRFVRISGYFFQYLLKK